MLISVQYSTSPVPVFSHEITQHLHPYYLKSIIIGQLSSHPHNAPNGNVDVSVYFLKVKKGYSFIIIFPAGSQLEHRAPFGVSVITHTKTHGRTPLEE
jgi:hypothetical protein